jgi:glycerol-3-phosphate cytidylyltransferase-like family protein
VNRYKKGNFPIMTLYERVLGVLSCKYVDEVVLGAPEKLTEEFIKNNNISVVVHGKDQGTIYLFAYQSALMAMMRMIKKKRLMCVLRARS